MFFLRIICCRCIAFIFWRLVIGLGLHDYFSLFFVFVLFNMVSSSNDFDVFIEWCYS